nr:integrase [Castellaniella caeni]
MPNTTHLPRVTAEDVRRFADTVEIRDARAFAAELQAFVYERVKAAKLHPPMEAETTTQALARKAVALRASKRWAPTETDIQRGRVVLLTTFNQPQNLPLAEFAKLANKSRQQIYKDIVARRLLSLNVGPRGQKLPDWQLDPVKQQLTQTILQKVEGIDPWTIYRALSEPLEGLGGRSPVDAVTPGSINDVAETVFNVLSVQVH